MKFKDNFIRRYLELAPVPLALERVLECNILSTKEFQRPILDIGCGEGLFATVLFDEKIDVGIDPNERELERTAEFQSYDELINCYGNEIPKADGSYKTIFSNSVMEHIPGIEDVLVEANRLLAVDGKLYLTLPTHRFEEYTVINQFLMLFKLNGLSKSFRKFFNSFWAHYHCYEREEWESLFKKNGFHVTDCREYGGRTLCTLNDAMAPLSIVALFVKKFTNKWFLFPKLRKLYVPVLVSLFEKFTIDDQNVEHGGLIFFQLEKI